MAEEAALVRPVRPGLRHAAPYWASFALVPLMVGVALTGGWTVLLVPAATWGLFSVLDAALGHDRVDLEPETPETKLLWYRAAVILWVPVQVALALWMLATVPSAEHLSTAERIGLFFGLGVLTGTVGITYAHELMHRPGRLERSLADILLATVFYGHFRSEHLLVHHVHVGTHKDPVTARLGEGFPAFFVRVLPACLRSAWAAERERLARRGRPTWDRANPFWRYVGLQVAFAFAALSLGGPAGLALAAFQALVAIWQLELVNYVEHYGLTRKPVGGGRFEPVRMHHSWNATQAASNRLLINLQRHSDHHARPARPFPLLQSGTGAAPELPYGYPVMTALAMVPPLWRRVMHPRVRAWRAEHYPEVADGRG